jgi:hypothetical protein
MSKNRDIVFSITDRKLSYWLRNTVKHKFLWRRTGGGGGGGGGGGR